MNKDKARITIRLGQADQTKNTQSIPPIKEKEQDSLQTFGELDNPSPDPLAHKEIAVSKETTNDDLEIYGPKYVPNSLPTSEKRRVPFSQKVRKKRSNKIKGTSPKGLGSAVLSVSGAIALGLVFGYVVLNFFNSNTGVTPHQPSTPSAAAPMSQQLPEQAKVESSGGQQQPPVQLDVNSKEGKKVSLHLPAQSFHMIQGGVFQNKENAKPILDKIEANGWPHIFQGETPLYLFLGVSLDRNQALAIANHFKDLDVYIKEYPYSERTITLPLKADTNVTQEEWGNWFTKESELITVVGKALSEGLNEGGITAETMKEVATSHRSFLDRGREIINKLQQQQELGNRFLNDYSKGITALQRFQKEPVEGYLWQAEQAFLDAFGSKEQFLTSFK
ncbi:hypothetical protein [Ammoniphilus resinae]|uniref:SPOR domain-containing protein n=1 Tax=Ammoniphilus resinae TaxID=861532 RepID=A0ABS4GJS0_9BACL|nr:hypothetical protein [Ammoniphilus resinae]MBP1930402.1 hypothetical protein [Ammoniphilus resinae]